MRRLGCPIALSIVLTGVASGAAEAQGRGSPNWTTTNSDAQRTGWVKSDPRISRESLQKPGFQLLWKTKLENQPRQLESLTQPLLLSNIISYKGFKALAFVGGSSDNVYSIDYDLNKMFWKRHLNTLPPAAGTIVCPGAMTTITRATPLGRTAPAPGDGGGGGGGRGGNTNVYAVSSGGLLHTLNPQTGDDLAPPIKFLPPNAKAVGSILIEPILYVATRDGCGSTVNGVYAINLGSDAKIVTHWESKGGSVAGTAGLTFGTNGNIYVATDGGPSATSSDANAIVALDPQTLRPNDWFSPGKTPFTASPVAFDYKGKHVIVAANADGRLYLLDAASLGGADHRTPLSKTPLYSSTTGDFTPGALATSENADGSRWVFAAAGAPLNAETTFGATNGAVTNGAIVAYRIVDQNGTPTLQPAWVSRDMLSPAPPAIVNGVVFAIASGEFRSGDAQMTAAQRAQRSRPAVLYALDAATGKELWSSGTTISSFVRGIGPSAGDGQVYVVTYDGTIYAFGIPLEH
jgi:putative pyrroloquinoline-quinone binding quinoprotein